MKYVELFAGIGGFRSALDRLGMKCVFASEIAKYAKQEYTALYGDEHLYGDITKIDVNNIPDHDLLVGGFPCQAFSVAGQRRGFEDTRGTLFFEIVRIAKSKQPKWLMLENVKGLLSHDNGRTFDIMCACLNDIGYAVDFKVLNSKHYGVPQNRERIFIIANRDVEHEDWRIEGNDVVAKAKRRIAKLGIKTFNFDFPNNKTVDKRLRDVLQENVDEKFYLSKEKTEKLIVQLNGKHTQKLSDVKELLLQEPSVQQIGYIQGDMQGYRVYDQEGLSTTVAAQTGGLDGNGAGLFVIDDQGRTTKKLKPLDIVPTLQRETHGNESKVVEPQIEKVGFVESDKQQNRVHSINGIMPTITANNQGGRSPGGLINEPQINDGIVKLFDIPKEVSNENELQRRVYGTEGVSPNVCARADYPKILEPQINNNLYVKGHDILKRVLEIAKKTRPNEEIEVKFMENGDIRPHRTDKRKSGISELNINHEQNTAFTVTSSHAPKCYGESTAYRIRKLTPLECFRLQGFTDEQFFKIKEARISDSQCYKMAGNAVTVNVIFEIGLKLVEHTNKK